MNARQPDAKVKLRAAFAAAKVPAEVELYRTLHGWCMPDMPAEARGGDLQQARSPPSKPGPSWWRYTRRRSPAADPRRWTVSGSSGPRLSFFARRSRASRRVTLPRPSALYRASLALVPGRASTLINLAAVQLPPGPPGRRVAERRMQRSPPSPAAPMPCFIAPRRCARLGRAEEALAAFRRLLASDPHHAAAWSASGSAAARNASARRGRACLPRGAAPWRRRGSARVLPRLGRGRRARPRPHRPPTSPACSTAMPTSSTAPRRRAALPGAPPAGRSPGRDLRCRHALPLGARPGLRDWTVRPAGAADGRSADGRRPVGANDRQGPLARRLRPPRARRHRRVPGRRPTSAGISSSPPTSSSTSATSRRSSPASGVR